MVRLHLGFLALAVALLHALQPATLATEQMTTAKEESRVAFRSPGSGPRPGASDGPTAQPVPQTDQKLLVTALDENGVAVPSAHVILTQSETPTVFKGETDYAGRHEFGGLSPGLYSLRVEKQGFYVVVFSDVRVGETDSAEVTLNHQQEFVERVDVVYSPPSIDLAQTATNETLTSQEIVNLPYPTTRDIRYALPLLPGVLQDATGQLHLEGSATQQVFNQLDGFNITHPTSGLFDLRLNVDALRAVEVQSSRYSAEYGKGSGGVLSLATGMGDDRYRFSATNFIPSFQHTKRFSLNNWTPRAGFSGPLRRGKAWFLLAPDGEYDSNIFRELPAGQDRNPVWRLSNLAKTQVNLSQAHVLTASFLVNTLGAEHAGLSRFDPVETTLNLKQQTYLFTVKEQSYLANGMLIEVGMGVYQSHGDEQPQGDLPYVVHPGGTSGNFFKTAEARARRLQWVANLIIPPVEWRGRHEFKLGTDFALTTYHQLAERLPISVQREDGTLSRQITFGGSPRFARNNFEVSSFAQDRWALSDRLLMESGLRFDWDQILRRILVSPRLAGNYLLTRDGNTKVSLGVGLFYDATNLDLITRPLNGRRFDLFYAPDGQTAEGLPVEISFRADERRLRAPRFLSWSVGLERRLPASVYLRAEFLEKRGSNGFAFVNLGADQPGQPSGRFELRNARRDHYDSIQICLRRTFKGSYLLFASYARSAARSNAVLDFNLDNPTDHPIFAQQAGGPLSWDAPNRLLSWGWLPLVKGFDFAYTLDWRSGFPFSLLNQNQQLVGSPNSRRLPAFFSLNVHLERRFRLFGCQWALRAGFDNLTNRQNPSEVNNNVDSSQFLTLGGLQSRAFTGRIRFLGRK